MNSSDSEEEQQTIQGINETNSDISNAESEHSLHDTDSEEELSDSNDEDNIEEEDRDNSNQGTSQRYVYGKNRYKWATHPPKNKRERTAAHNLVIHLPGLKGPAQLTKPASPYEAWSLLITKDIRKNKREIPSGFCPNKNREVQSSIFGFTGDRTIVSYVPKKNRSVILLSSMHDTNSVNPNTKKPEIVEFYNSTKTGVDSLDHKCASYSCHRRTRRWPLAIFYAMMNIARVNSFVLYKAANPINKMTRRAFNISIGQNLIFPHLRERLQEPALQKELRSVICKILNVPEDLSRRNDQERPLKRQRCALCPRKYDRKYSTKCKQCLKAVCQAHSIQSFICKTCEEMEM